MLQDVGSQRGELSEEYFLDLAYRLVTHNGVTLGLNRGGSATGT